MVFMSTMCFIAQDMSYEATFFVIYRKDLEEEQACRRALQKREVPNYFDSEWGKSFLLSLSAGPDMDALTKNLAVETRKGEGEGNNHSLPSTPAETPISARKWYVIASQSLSILAFCNTERHQGLSHRCV